LGLLDADAIAYELAHSKNYFESLTRSEINFVSYPYGTDEACTKQVAESAREAGYKAGFTTTRGMNNAAQDHFLLHRYDCNDLPGGKHFI
jgi:hypothetical protein